MNRLTVIIPTRNLSNLMQCATAVRQNDPNIRIIVVDDALPAQPDGAQLEYVQGVKPFIFARNINIGIRAAGDSDVVLLNDDATLKTPGGFSDLQRAALSNPDFGMVASSCNNVGNVNQNRLAWDNTYKLREEPRTLCFICVFIPRSVLSLVGYMDERFGGRDENGEVIYGFCDDDMSKRIRDAGYKLGIFDGCFVDHFNLPSSFRQEGPRPLEPGHRQFILKHGVDNRGNTRERSAWPHLFPAPVQS